MRITTKTADLSSRLTRKFHSRINFDSPEVFDEDENAHPAGLLRAQQRINLIYFAGYPG